MNLCQRYFLKLDPINNEEDNTSRVHWSKYMATQGLCHI